METKGKKFSQMLAFSVMFFVIAILAFYGGCIGKVWHFYTCFLALVLSRLLYIVHKADMNGNF